MKVENLKHIHINLTINNQKKEYCISPSTILRDLLHNSGYLSVKDSDDREGFCGSDTIILNGELVYSNLILAATVDNSTIITAEYLGTSQNIGVLQQALIDVGVVQSAYNAPSAALVLYWLLENYKSPTKEDIKNALSGIFIRDAGYEHYYKAVRLVEERTKKGSAKTTIAPSFLKETKIIGKPGEKVDAKTLIAGERAFVEDYVTDDTLYMSILRSPHASAYINSIDTTAAEALDGVVKILTAFNTPEIYYMQAGQGNPEPSPHDRRLFNMKVRHFGDRVAAILATSKEVADKAKKLIKVDYDVQKAVFTVEEAMKEGAPLVHNGVVEYRSGAPSDIDEYNKKAGDKREGKVVYQFPLHADIRKNIAASNKGGIGDVDKAFREADAIVERTYQTSQIQHTPLEPHVCFAKMELGRLIVYASTQVPYHVRRICSWVTGLSENKIHVVKTRVGGGYGSKQDILVEDLTSYASFVTGRPVYYRNTREEEFIANSTRHPMRVYVKASATKDGTLTGIYMEVRANTGPYGNHCLTVPMNSCSKTLPLFKCENMKYDLKVYYTNTPPAGAYQGYGTPKGNYGIMMALCELSKKIGMDYKDFILKNQVEEGYMLEILKGLGEGREGAVVPVGSCGLKQCIERGAELIEWGKKEKNKDPNWKIGKGFAIMMQGSGLPGLDHSEAIAKLETDGSIILLSGGADIGTGLDTVSHKIAAEILKVPFDKITVISGDTDSCAFDTGAYASSGTFFSGNASYTACKLLEEKILIEASLQMEEDKANLYLEDGGVVKSKTTGKSLTFYELSHTACSGIGRGQVIAHGNFVTKASSVPYAAHFAQVRVNTLTGEVKIDKYYAISDIGTPINPEIALCQVYGAVQKCIGHTLYEGMILDNKGRCINANMTDYGAPMIREAPDDLRVEFVDIKDKYGPYGAKSISELSCNGTSPAVGTAIYDAIGVWIESWPFSREKILRALKKF